MRRFKISTEHSGRKRTIQVCVYDTLEQMRRAGEAYSRKHTAGQTGFNEAYGLSQIHQREYVFESGAVRKHPYAGFIRLARGHLQAGLLAHECTHMAIGIYQQDVQRTIPDMEREEKLCYLVGDLMARLTAKLYEYELL